MKIGVLAVLFPVFLLKWPLLAVDSVLISMGGISQRLDISRLIVTDKERRQVFRCAVVVGLLLFLHFYYSVPFCVLFVFLTLSLLLWLYPFKVVDDQLGRLLSKTVYAFEPERWGKCHKDRTKIYPIYLLGVSLIIMLPFQHYRHIVEVFQIQLPLPFISEVIESNQTFEFWELAVCLWSLLFLLIFFLRELGEHADRLELKPGKSVFLGIGGFIIVAACAFAAGYLLLSHKPAESRIGAELLISGLLCASDVLFYFWYKQHKADELADDFTLFLMVLDGPSLLAFLVLWGYLSFSAAGPSDWKLPFASGAAALNLVLVNTVFSFLYIIERYRSTGAANHAGTCQAGEAPIASSVSV